MSALRFSENRLFSGRGETGIRWIRSQEVDRVLGQPQGTGATQKGTAPEKSRELVRICEKFPETWNCSNYGMFTYIQTELILRAE